MPISALPLIEELTKTVLASGLLREEANRHVQRYANHHAKKKLLASTVENSASLINRQFAFSSISLDTGATRANSKVADFLFYGICGGTSKPAFKNERARVTTAAIQRLECPEGPSRSHRNTHRGKIACVAAAVAD